MMSYIIAGLIGLHHVGLWIFLGIFIVGIPLAVRGMSASYLRPTPGGFALCQPWEQRTFLGLMGILCFFVPQLVIGDNLRSHGGVARREFEIEAWILEGISLVSAAFFWWASRPRDLAVDESRRTYRRSEGWPPFRRVYTGPLSDLSGVWAEQGNDYRVHLVCVGWRTGPSKQVVEHFGSAEGAAYYADELAAILGIPRLFSSKLNSPIDQSRLEYRRRRRPRRYQSGHG